jgi:hypothetical protein
MDQIRGKEIDSVPNPRQRRRVTTAKKNDTPTHRNQRRIVSVTNEGMGNGKGGGDLPHSPDSFEDGDMDRGGTSAMGFTNRIPLLDSMNTPAQPAQKTEKYAVLSSHDDPLHTSQFGMSS